MEGEGEAVRVGVFGAVGLGDGVAEPVGVTESVAAADAVEEGVSVPLLEGEEPLLRLAVADAALPEGEAVPVAVPLPVPLPVPVGV